MKIKTEDLQIILSWIRGNKIFSNEINEWDGLLIRISLYKEEFIDIDDLLEKRLKTYINNEEYEKCVDLVKEIDTMKNHLTKA